MLVLCVQQLCAAAKVIIMMLGLQQLHMFMLSALLHLEDARCT